MKSLSKSWPYQLLFGLVSLSIGIFILVNQWDLTTTGFIITGVISVLTGVLLAGVEKPSWPGIFVFIIFGFYMLARAAGLIEHQLFRFGVGGVLTILGLIHLMNIWVSFVNKKVSKDE